jgi:hypothetical protein
MFNPCLHFPESPVGDLIDSESGASAFSCRISFEVLPLPYCLDAIVINTPAVARLEERIPCAVTTASIEAATRDKPKLLGCDVYCLNRTALQTVIGTGLIQGCFCAKSGQCHWAFPPPVSTVCAVQLRSRKTNFTKALDGVSIYPALHPGLGHGFP